MKNVDSSEQRSQLEVLKQVELQKLLDNWYTRPKPEHILGLINNLDLSLPDLVLFGRTHGFNAAKMKMQSTDTIGLRIVLRCHYNYCHTFMMCTV